MRTLPLILAQASLVLYPQNASGGAVTSAPVWFGARVEGLGLNASIEEIPSTPSGAEYLEFEQGHETHTIKISRIWVVSVREMQAAQLARGKYVMDIIHEDRAHNRWFRYTYFGVTIRSFEIQSVGIMQYGENQEFRASRRTEDSGLLPTLPAPPSPYVYMSMISVTTLAELALTPGGGEGQGCFVNCAGELGGGFFRFYGASQGVADGWDLVTAPNGQWKRMTSI